TQFLLSMIEFFRELWIDVSRRRQRRQCLPVVLAGPWQTICCSEWRIDSREKKHADHAPVSARPDNIGTHVDLRSTMKVPGGQTITDLQTRDSPVRADEVRPRYLRARCERTKDEPASSTPRKRDLTRWRG